MTPTQANPIGDRGYGADGHPFPLTADELVAGLRDPLAASAHAATIAADVLEGLPAADIDRALRERDERRAATKGA